MVAAAMGAGASAGPALDVCHLLSYLLLLGAIANSGRGEAGRAAAADISRDAEYVSARDLVVSGRARGSTLADAQLWGSSDGGQSWIRLAAQPQPDGSLAVSVPADGSWVFRAVRRAGPGQLPPQGLADAHDALICVDTAPPTLQLHDGLVAREPGRPAQLRLSLTLLEENLADGGVRLFYRAGGERAWRDGGALACSQGQADWTLPDEPPDVLDMRVVAIDRAGNRAADELCGVLTGGKPSEAREDAEVSLAAHVDLAPVSEHAAPEGRTAGLDTMMRPVEDVLMAETSAFGDAPETNAVRRAAGGAVRRLREQAQRHVEEGRLALALARLEDALREAPADPDLLSEAGGVLARAQRWSEAREHFRSALASDPEHVGALEGQALVAFSQREFEQAREHLLALLRLRGEARHRLRYGDTESQLGNTAAARHAWQGVIDDATADATLRERAKARLARTEPGRAR
jgi:tetratricopeptide (TPR) repeat protein